MKLAIITDDGYSISKHFGRAAYYQVLTINTFANYGDETCTLTG
jgi:predicted Fe-Mo cluster-binding NifX family protein